MNEEQLMIEELYQAIEEANQGLLSPYWQQYYSNMLEEVRDADEFPENGEAIAKQLREAIQNHPQISDAEQARRELEQQESELLFYRSADFGTLLEIVYTPSKGCFTCAVEIDSTLPKEEQWQRALELRLELRKWTELSGIEMETIRDVLTCAEERLAEYLPAEETEA